MTESTNITLQQLTDMAMDCSKGKDINNDRRMIIITSCMNDEQSSEFLRWLNSIVQERLKQIENKDNERIEKV